MGRPVTPNRPHAPFAIFRSIFLSTRIVVTTRTAGPRRIRFLLGPFLPEILLASGNSGKHHPIPQTFANIYSHCLSRWRRSLIPSTHLESTQTKSWSGNWVSSEKHGPLNIYAASLPSTRPPLRMAHSGARARILWKPPGRLSRKLNSYQPDSSDAHVQHDALFPKGYCQTL